MSTREPAPIAEDLVRRVWVRAVRPAVDGGEFPIKRTVGEGVVVTAEVFADGHDLVAAALRYRAGGSGPWHELRMRPAGQDSWSAEFPIEALCPHFYTVAGWIDRFGSWAGELRKKEAAGQRVHAELLEGAQLVRQAAARASEPDRGFLLGTAGSLEQAETAQDRRVELALGAELRACVDRYPDRSAQTEYPRVLAVDVARERARCGAWYEMFPRSEGGLRQAEQRLADVRALGFDVVYLPPVHPIGRAHRKGRNNALEAGPDDPGSPWAIGAAAGGHTALHPDLGTLDDFARFVRAAGSQDLEIALDLAFQCSPDHPWVREHPQWFRQRPDGSIKYAENPPKRYQDIYPLDFECREWPALWQALRDVVRCWIERGVRIFRVDNPHTKPLRFWGWLISEIRAEHPETIFLAEAFTRPNVMHTLAKLGFDQSYTYFTWRNSKRELTDYLTELTRTEVREFLRPNFFANTPDILPEYLQVGGRPAFQVRATLAATLAASYGIYSGFELCEAEALPGSEEYRDSEKYEIRKRDWSSVGNIRDYIRRLNRVRRENPALTRDDRLRFYEIDNEQLVCYGKSTPDLSNVIVVVVNLDPHNAHEGWLELPLDELGLAEADSYQMHDLLGESRFLWSGARNFVRLDPAAAPAHVLRLRRRTRTERDFDYYL